jgi:transposase
VRVARAVILDPEQKAKLEQQARTRSLPSRVVERSRIVLMAASGQQDIEIAAKLMITPKKVARWRERFQKQGVAGLLKDAPRPGRKPTITPSIVQKVIDKTTQEKPSNATH